MTPEELALIKSLSEPPKVESKPALDPWREFLEERSATPDEPRRFDRNAALSVLAVLCLICFITAGVAWIPARFLIWGVIGAVYLMWKLPLFDGLRSRLTK